MFRVGRDKNVVADVDAGARAFLESDDRQAVQKVIEHLFAFGGGLLGDAVANLSPPRPPIAAAAAKA